MILGRIPVGMRQHVAQVILAPESYYKIRPGIAAETRGTTTVFLSAMSLGIAVHEFSHILDAVIGSQQHLYQLYKLSSLPEWKEFYDSDTKVPTVYAASSLVEDFADAGRWAMSNMARSRTHQDQTASRDGSGRLSVQDSRTTASMDQLAVYSADWKSCRNQIAGYRALLEDVIFPPGGRCTAKTPTSDAVDVKIGQYAKYNQMGAGRLKLRSVGVP
ncbi:conidiation-specific protein (con-13) protein [Apiospora phragmitis]|uniref:Conidiation-specific protein (Con-13) protein n=1 Tax=Apiospora phragmitis TaxID=2905665 RepID=A0ABR1WTM8_9PEZI